MTAGILVALDTTDANNAAALAAALRGAVAGVKLGLEFFGANGPAGVRQVAAEADRIFLDLKFHDIPNTVAGAVRAVVPLTPFLLTVHVAGGADMLRATVEAAAEAASRIGRPRPQIIGVTVMTSLNDDDLNAIGQRGPADAQVRRLAELALRCGLDGVVCSPHEIAALRADCGPDFTLVVPGIRPSWAAAGDQKRIMPPAEAARLGASFLVIGRPITGAADPVGAARRIVGELREH
jgi:orotidine-5'-phosphate decarboxylase